MTICGPGGMGKTRLALESMTRSAPTLADGVVFVALQPVHSADGIATAIAEAVGIPLTGADAPFEYVCAALCDRRMLLLFDTTEQLGDEVTLFSRLLAAVPGLTLLATSREALKLREEWLYPLEGLALPDDPAGAGGESAALRLFLERALQAHPNLVPATERPAAIEICRLVEGMPLAIELAAAWTRTLSCATIAAEIRRNLDLLTSNLRDLPERHRSLCAVCDQSWLLLNSAEQRTFARLARFCAGFSAEAAAAVAGANLPLLDSLVGKSLLRRTGSERYQIHELLHQYGEERLAAEPDAVIQTDAAIGRYYLDFLGY